MLEDFKFVTRHRLFTTDDFWFEVDEYSRPRPEVGGSERQGDQMLIAHLRAAHWSPSVRKQCHEIWQAFRQCVTAPIFTWGQVDDKKFERFVRSFGYELTPTTITCANGEQRRLYIHRL